MSYSGTVRCGWCYNSGHNKVGCPQRAQYIKDNPDGYEAKQEEQRKRYAKVRTCSYCKETGHNRKTCGNVKGDRQKFINKNIELRKTVLDWMKESGVGIGSLLQCARDRWQVEADGPGWRMLLVTSMRWANVRIDFWNGEAADPRTWNTSFLACLPVGGDMTQDHRRWNALSLIREFSGKVPPEQIDDMPPVGWKDSTDSGTLDAIEESLKSNTMNHNRKYYLEG